MQIHVICLSFCLMKKKKEEKDEFWLSPFAKCCDIFSEYFAFVLPWFNPFITHQTTLVLFWRRVDDKVLKFTAVLSGSDIVSEPCPHSLLHSFASCCSSLLRFDLVLQNHSKIKDENEKPIQHEQEQEQVEGLKEWKSVRVWDETLASKGGDAKATWISYTPTHSHTHTLTHIHKNSVKSISIIDNPFLP